MNPKLQVGLLLAFLAMAPGCEYLHPDPMRAPISQNTDDRSGLAQREKSSGLDEGILGFLQESTYNLFKAYQETGQ
jgi:hypothetical protein